jgi:ribosomal-protein-alanine N-acetyltransferase
MGTLIRAFEERDFEAICLLEQGGKGSAYSSAVFVRQASVVFSPWFFVAERDGEVLGYGIGALNQEHRDEGWILRLRVHERWQGRGIGRLLLDHAIRSLTEDGATRILLSVSPDNTRAVRLYRNSGFFEVGTVPRYFGPGEDRFIMRRDVTGEQKRIVNPSS